MWQMYHLTGAGIYKDAAVWTEEKMDKNFHMPDKLDHDNGFKWLLTAVADYKVTKEKASYDRVMLAAITLAGRYNPAGKFIRAWNEWGNEEHLGWAIIDCMMNLPMSFQSFMEIIISLKQFLS